MRPRISCFSTLFLLSLSPMTYAAPAVFNIDPAQSQITISGQIAGSDVKEQGPGSLTTKFGGTIKVEITGSTIQFTGGSVLDAQVNGTWEPGLGGNGGSAPADFAGKAGSFITAKGAFRNIVLDVTSAPVALAGGNFDASALSFGFPAGSAATLDYDIVLSHGSRALNGLSTNKVTEAGTLTTEAGVQKLVIRVDTEFKFKALTDNDSTARLVGQLVATGPSQGTELVISAITFADKKLSLTVEGTAANAQLQSTADLKSWQPRSAERKTDGNKVIYTVEQTGGNEFFRVAQ